MAPMNQRDFVVFSMSLRLPIGSLSGLGAIPPEQNNNCLTKKGDNTSGINDPWYLLVTSSAFISYLIDKTDKAGVGL